MAYIRVLPRDLFNEADLLKCYARLWIELDRRHDHRARFLQEQVHTFDIRQDESSGDITVANLTFKVRGRELRLYRPLNARSSFPLYVTDGDEIDIRVFDEDGTLAADMIALIKEG